MKKAIYTGSFDPVTLGHMDIIRRAADTFDELVVGVLNNKEKKPLFSVEERVKILQEAVRDIPNVKIDSFSGLFVDYAREKDIWIAVRGLRAITDLEYEMQMAQTNRMLSGGKLDTVFFVTNLDYSYISSSGVKQITGIHSFLRNPAAPDLIHTPVLLLHFLRQNRNIVLYG